MGAGRWILTTSGDRPLSEVVDDARAAGFAVEDVLEAIGVITGSADDDVADAVRAVSGVVDVSADQSVDIGPPDAETTW